VAKRLDQTGLVAAAYGAPNASRAAADAVLGDHFRSVFGRLIGAETYLRSLKMLLGLHPAAARPH
jgi:hypothetical protein